MLNYCLFKVATLVGKMEWYCSIPVHPNIFNALDRYLETIHNVQDRRRDELVNASGRPKHKRSYPQEDRGRDNPKPEH